MITITEKLIKLIQWIQARLGRKQFIFVSSVLVGLSVGLAAIVLKTFVHYLFIAATLNPIESKLTFLILPVIGILLTVLLIRKVFKNRFDKGLSHIHYAIAQKSSIIPQQQMYSQILTSSLTVGLGGSAGLEAPIVITGAAFGSNYARVYNLNYQEKTLLLACGIAAGIGAMFNAPIAGVLFALEVLLIDISIAAFTPLIISAATGALISKIILQDDILLSFQLAEPFNYVNVPFYLILGLLAGLASVYHSRMFIKIEGLFSESTHGKYLPILMGGTVLAILISIFPSLFGEGYQSIKVLASQQPENLLDNSFIHQYKNNEWIVLCFVGALIFLKSVATGITLGCGGNGGNFAPSLFVGSYLGYFLAKSVNMMHLTRLPENNFTIVGMAGILSGLYHAPLTAIFLIAEITGGYDLMIPLMIVSSVSYAIAKYFEPYSMDTKKLASSGHVFTDDKDHNILTTIRTSQLIETDFKEIGPDDTLQDLVEIISTTSRNIFPVTDHQNKLLGIIILDNIRSIIFKQDMYDKVLAKELMSIPPVVIDVNDTMELVMKKFDETGAWNLPVIKSGQYLGFISKSNVFSSYRTKLKTNTI